MTHGHPVETALESSASSLLAYLIRRVSLDDAPDLLGDTMVVAWRRRAELPDDPERARMWLFGIARGTLLNQGRGERRRWALIERVRTLLPDVPPTDTDDAADVRDALNRLEPDLAELVRLVHWDGFTLAEAAEVIGVPASTARGRYQRARRALREALGLDEAASTEASAATSGLGSACAPRHPPRRA